jgi:copper chaperone CopZ
MANATVQVSGVRCERCIGRLAGVLRGHDGIESANANLMGEVSLAWDAHTTSREEILATLARSGFPELGTARCRARQWRRCRESL